MAFWNLVGKAAIKVLEVGAGLIVFGIVKAVESKNEIDNKAERMSYRSDSDLVNRMNDKDNSLVNRSAAKKVLDSRHGNSFAKENFQKRNNTKKYRDETSHNENKALKRTKYCDSPAFRAGDDRDNKTTIVLSAPGQAEEKAGRPAAGQTGKTLQKVVEELHKKDPMQFKSDKLDDYSILNARENVEYKSKTGRTEGSNSEIKDSANIDRIKRALKNSETVVALGDKANIAVSEAGFQGNVYSGSHPSMQSLNKKYSSDKETPNERSSDRIKQWSNDLMDQKE